MLKKLADLLDDERGQGLVEYALIVALISIVAITALRLIGTRATSKLTSAAGALT